MTATIGRRGVLFGVTQTPPHWRAVLQRVAQEDRHVERFGAADLHERAFADQLLEQLLVDFARGNARVEDADGDVEQFVFGDRRSAVARA